MRGVLTVILAGGKGTRLEPLTRDRAKPAVPFGGLYRIIDFTLSNCINSDLRRDPRPDAVQGAQPRPAHPRRAGASSAASSASTSRCCRRSSASTRHWYKGTADAIYQNIYTHREGRTPSTS